jgi:hypothetical protein
VCDFVFRVGDEPAGGRLPLRQRWQLVTDGVAPLHLQLTPCADAPRLKFAVITNDLRHGEIWALNERALSDGRRVIQTAHQGEVRFDAPHVHAHVDPRLRVPMEPLMFVKVNARREHMDAVLTQLRSRGARMQDVELEAGRVIVRAEALLRALIGFDAAVREIGAGSAQVFSWLVRYQAVQQQSERGE